MSLKLQKRKQKTKIIKIKSLSQGRNAVYCKSLFQSYSNSKKETSLYACLSGSFMVETAIVLPIFVCFLVSILFFFRILQVQENVEEALQYTGRELAIMSYGGEDAVSLIVADAMLKQQLKELDSPLTYVKGGTIGVDYLLSDVKGDYIDLIVKYKMQLPFSMFGKTDIELLQGTKARKWTGYHGEDTDRNGEDWVYVTENGVVYHRSMDCSYLDLSIRCVKRNEVDKLRSENGNKYNKCLYCKEDADMVYITNYGNCYHTSLSCQGLKRTVYLIPLSESLGYGACSKCVE